MKAYELGSAVGLGFSIESAWFFGSLVLCFVASAIGIAWLGLTWAEAILFGLLCVVLHWLAELLHQLGHARAARQTGNSMIAIRFGKWGLLGTAVYPADEPTLPASIHSSSAFSSYPWRSPTATDTGADQLLLVPSWPDGRP